MPAPQGLPPQPGKHCPGGGGGRAGGEAASLGVLPRGPGVGSRLRSPGPGRRRGWLGLPDQQQQQREEMNNLGRSRASGLSGRGVPRVRSVVIFTVYLLGWVGLFLCIVIFSPVCLFFCPFFFFFFFFLLCLCVCVILSFGRAGSRRRGVLACCSFHRKRGPGAGRAAPWDSWDEGAGRGKKSFLSQIPGLGSRRETERRGSDSVGHSLYPLQPPRPLEPVTSVPDLGNLLGDPGQMTGPLSRAAG